MKIKTPTTLELVAIVNMIVLLAVFVSMPSILAQVFTVLGVANGLFMAVYFLRKIPKKSPSPANE